MPFVSLVQDFYNVTMPAGSSTQVYIDAKFEATTAHITNATSTLNPDQLYITFASAFSSSETPQVATYFYFLFLFTLIHLLIPCQIFALGTGDVQGMNQRLLPWLTERQGQRFGIISAFLRVNLLSNSLLSF